MIVVDTSALAAIVFGEAEGDEFVEAIRSAGHVLISTATVLEARMVVRGRKGAAGTARLDEWLKPPIFEWTAPGPEDVDVAFAAFLAFGRGSRHPAALNFGDLFAYALAKTRNLPLLYKGADFAATDIVSAVAPP